MTSDAGTVVYASTEASRRRRTKQCIDYDFKAKGDELRRHFRTLELEACQRELLPWVPAMRNIHALQANLMVDLPKNHPARLLLEALQQRLFKPLQTILKKDSHSVTARDIAAMKHLTKTAPLHLKDFQDFLKSVRHNAKSSEDMYENLRADFMNFQGAFGKQKRSPAVAA